jgi:hypothetical protein
VINAVFDKLPPEWRQTLYFGSVADVCGGSILPQLQPNECNIAKKCATPVCQPRLKKNTEGYVFSGDKAARTMAPMPLTSRSLRHANQR